MGIVFIARIWMKRLRSPIRLHLNICRSCTSDAVSIAKQIRHAGAIFLGPYSPTALGDYAAGPSHVLPTMGTARFFSGLSLSSFTKTSHVIAYQQESAGKSPRAFGKSSTCRKHGQTRGISECKV